MPGPTRTNGRVGRRHDINQRHKHRWMGRKEREPIRGFCRPIPIYLGRACARMASALPEGGADLLAFKRQASEARDLHADAIGDANPFGVANPGILDDPLERIAELEGFDELDGDGDDHQRDALQHVHEASRCLLYTSPSPRDS